MTPAVSAVKSTEQAAWYEAISLSKAVQASVGDHERILSVTKEHVSRSSENAPSLLLRITVAVQLRDGSQKDVKFMLKTPSGSELMADILQMLQLFPKEESMYQKIIPKFEALYREAGKEVKLAPQAFTVDRDVGADYVLLEDLLARGFKNANAAVGMDMPHMLEALEKLAEFHAASACYVEHYGLFGEEFRVGVFSDANRALLKEFNASEGFLAQLKKWKNCEPYYKRLVDSDSYLVDRLLEDQKFNPREFNVLNHGDCWTNNIMFNEDAFGNIRSCVFLDFQLGKYGSPANDLYYLILSSAALDIKLSKFDYMVRYYYDKLVANLGLLQYHRPLPKLRSLHTALLKNGLAAYLVVTKVLPVVMWDHGAAPSNMDESKFKAALYGNPKYAMAMAEILPWLDNRGLLDWK